MKRIVNYSQVTGKLAAVAIATLLCSLTLIAQTVPNPSFEANSFTVAPGYISDNAPITGWTADNASGAGLSPTAGDNTFANNGATPDGNNVAFITGGTTLSTTITGLTAGKIYKIVLQANASTNETTLSPILRANVDGVDVIALNIYAVGTTRPYEYIAFEFPAAADTAVLSLVNDATPDQTLLIDNLTIAESSGRWELSAWNDDATSGVDNQYVYTHAYNFGSTANPLINGILFTGVGGANPAVAGQFSVTHVPNVLPGDVNNITGGSAILAHDFVYSGASVDSGDYETLTIANLTPNTDYVLTLYTAGWEDPTTSSRWATLSVGNDRLTFNQDQYFNDNGQKISYRYTSGADGTVKFNIAPVNSQNVSIHLYGFSNREAVSRNVKPTITVQPTSTTVAEGLPIDLKVAVTGFPAPTFQWRKGAVNLNGATTDTYSIAAATAGNVGDYDVIVANSVGSVTSIVARVVVGLPQVNSSFEADSFLSWPGYIGDNNPGGHPDTPPGANGPITGWIENPPESVGLNPISNGQSPFADNGTIPNGAQVAFLQSFSPDTPVTLSQTIDGLTVGSQYYLHYYENARAATPDAALEVTLGGVTVVPVHSVPSGAYREVSSDVFTASATSLELMFLKTSPSGSDTTVLIDNVAIVPVAAGTAPTVVKGPEPIAAYTGGTATFTAQFNGSLPFTYQWLKNGAPITGETNPQLTINNLDESAEADYSLRVTNSAGSVTTAAAHLTVNARIPGIFNTGVDNSDAPLVDGDIDPHFKLVANAHFPDSQDAIVEDSTVFPIVAGPWLGNTAISKWIGPELNTVDGAVGFYTYQLTIDLTGRDPRSVLIRGRWASDNAGRDIRVNGISTGNTESPGFNAYTSFAIYGTNTTFTAGTNTIDFVVENQDAAGYTGLRVEFLETNSLPGETGGGAQLAITRTGDSISVSWSPAAAGQKLQSATNIAGPWSDVQNATNPYSTPTTGTTLFFRVSQ